MAPLTRRSFLKTSLAAGTGIALAPSLGAAPMFVRSSVLKGPSAPSNRINIGVIGTGRIARDHDMPGVMKFDDNRIIAVCDLDDHRVREARQLVESTYKKRFGKCDVDVAMYSDYEELLARPDIDAVIICTPDH